MKIDITKQEYDFLNGFLCKSIERKEMLNVMVDRHDGNFYAISTDGRSISFLNLSVNYHLRRKEEIQKGVYILSKSNHGYHLFFEKEKIELGWKDVIPKYSSERTELSFETRYKRKKFSMWINEVIKSGCDAGIIDDEYFRSIPAKHEINRIIIEKEKPWKIEHRLGFIIIVPLSRR